MTGLTLTKAEKIQQLKEWFGKTRLAAEVVGQTINVNSNSISPAVLLATSAKLVKVNKREVEPDDRDNLRYSKFLGMEDYVREHIIKDAGRLQQKAKMKMEQKRNLDWLHAGFFSPQVRSVTIGNSLSQNLEGINPIEHLDVASKVTKLGEGGISSTTAIPAESRQVESSQFGLMDPFHIPETEAIGVTNYISRNVRKGDDGKLYRLMLDKDKKPCWIDHETLLNSRVEVPEF